MSGKTLEKEEIAKKSKPLVGIVSGDKMSKSRVAEIERTVKHSAYGKYLKRRSRIMFHDEKNESKVGDKVLIIPARPRSSRKRFDLLSIVERAAD